MPTRFVPGTWDVGRQRRRPSDRRTGTNPGRLRDLPKDDPDFPHGGSAGKGYPTGYAYGCRCDVCTKANAEYMANWRRTTTTKNRAKTNKPYAPQKVAQHGTRAKYTAGCHCEPCTLANRDYQRQYMRLLRSGVRIRDELIEAVIGTH